MKKIINIFSLLIVIILLNACGEGTVDLGSKNFTQKIVLEGYLVPEHPVSNILITRNFPLNTPIDVNSVSITNADARITAIETGIEYKLVYDAESKSYKYPGNDLIIGYNKSYKLSVKAVIDGKELSVISTTTTPYKGFKINKNTSVLGEMQYRQKNQDGTVEKVKLVFDPSPQIDFYAIGTIALDANANSFIYDNPYLDIDTNDVIKDMNKYKYESTWITGIKSDAFNSIKEIEWMDLWFYGNYRTIMYAGDRNFKDYFITINQLQEMDGNYHEPKLHMEGDGIGVFGSYIADTVYYKIKK